MLWDVSTAVYDNKSLVLTSQGTLPMGVFFNSDGTKLYVLCYSLSRTVYQYTLSVAWDVNTAIYASKSFNTESEAPMATDLFLSPSGTKLYIIDYSSRSVHQYSLSTPWDISTSTYDNKSFNVENEEYFPLGLFFKSDGTKLYVTGDTDAVFQYSLLTPWDVSTASYDSKSKDLSNEDTFPNGLFFKPDGTKMYVAGDSNNTIYQYTLSTPWDVGTANYNSKYKDVSDEDTYVKGVFLDTDGGRMYIAGGVNATIFQYTLEPVTTEAASDIGIDHAKGNGTASGTNITERGFEVRLAFSGTLLDYMNHSIAGFEGDVTYSAGSWAGTLVKTVTETGTFDEGAFEGDLGRFPTAVASDKLFAAETYGYRAYAVIDGVTYYGDYIEFTTDSYPAGQYPDDQLPIVDFIPIEPLVEPFVKPSVESFIASLTEPLVEPFKYPFEGIGYIAGEFPELELPGFEFPEFTYPEMPPYNGSWLGWFYYRKAYTKKDLDELRKKCRVFQDNSVEFALVINHNSRVLQQFLNNMTDYMGADEHNTFRPLIPTQHLNELARSPLDIKDFRTIINNFISNSIDNANNVNNNFRLIRDGLSDYTYTEDEGFRDITITTRIVNDANSDVDRLKEVVDRLNKEMGNNYRIINHNLHVLRSVLI